MHGRLGLSDMNDEFFDPLDDHIDGELRRRFEAASPRASGDPDAVLDSLRPQMQRARTRRRAAIGGTLAGAVALVAVAGFALTGGPSSSNNVNTPPATRSEPRPGVTDTTAPVSPLPEPAPTSLKESGTNGGASLNGGASDSGSSSGTSKGSSGSSGNGETATTVPAPQTQTFSSPGGSITVTLANASLSLADTAPAPGQFVKVTKNEAAVVEVEFYSRSDFSGPRTSRIRVELVNGAMVQVGS